MATLAEKLHQEGRVEGEAIGRRTVLIRVLRDLLAHRFGEEGLALMPMIESTADPDRLEALYRQVLEARDLDDIRDSLKPGSGD